MAEAKELEEKKTEASAETVESPEAEPKAKPEKMLTQAEVNKLMADERRKHKQELDALRGEYDEFRGGVEAKEKAANDAAAAKVAKLRENLPEAIGKLLDKLTPIEQLEWLSDPANVIEKKQIPPMPPGRDDQGRERRAQQII